MKFLQSFQLKKFCLSLMLPFILLMFFSTSAFSSTTNSPGDIIGRWDISIDMNGATRPAWLEVKLSGSKTLVGRFVGVVGSARPISKVNFEDGKISFTIPPQWWLSKGELQVEGKLKKGRIKGTLSYDNGESYHWTAQKAPILRKKGTPTWGPSISLFSGKDLSKWHATGEENQWKVVSGVLKSPHSGSNLVTNEKFNNFKLHVEVKYPQGSNSGIYLRGRYEVQVVDSTEKEPSDIDFGSIYGFLPPSEMATKGAGEWQTFDITLIGRMVTIIANGKIIIYKREIPGITGGALDSNEGEPGPIMLQGDHGPVAYRNISITPTK